MFYVRVPLSRQIFINLFLLALIAGGCIYLTQKNIYVLEYKSKIAFIQKMNNYFFSHKEEKVNHLMRDMVTRLIYNLPFNEMPSHIVYFEWHEDKPNIPIYRREADNFIVSDEFLESYRNKVFKRLVAPEPDKIPNVYCTTTESCTLFLHKRYNMGERSGIAIYGIRLNSLIESYKQLASYAGIIFLEPHNQNLALNEWKNKPISPNTRIIPININKLNKDEPLIDLKSNPTASQITYNDYTQKFAAKWGFTREIYTPFIIFGQNLGYNVTFIPEPKISDILLLPTPENFTSMLCLLILLGGVLIYQLRVLLRTYNFIANNATRIKRYAPTAAPGFAQDETIALVNMLDSAISSAEKRDTTIQKLNQKLALFDYYDTASSLPNAKWINEQLIRSISSYASDISKTYYLVLFTTSIKEDYLNAEDHLSTIASRILSTVGEANNLAMFSENTFALLTSDCADNNAVCQLLDKIKGAIKELLPPDDNNFHIRAGMVSVISPTITHTELIRRALAALQSSIADKNDTDNYTLFSAAIGRTATENSLLETSLRKAKLSGELLLKYELIYNTKVHSVVGLKAHPYWLRNGTAVSLLDYKDDIISSGLNIEYNYWKIENCLFDLNELDNKLNQQINIVIKLNLGQLTDPNLTSMLDVLTLKYSVMPTRIYFSISEDDISSDLDAAHLAIKNLLKSGYHVNLEDYGLGYADCAFVKRFGFDSVTYSPIVTNRLIRTEYDRQMITNNIKQLQELGTVGIWVLGIDNILTARTMANIGVYIISGPLLPQDCLISQVPEAIANTKFDEQAS
ncbi:MAG: EAL domain-containing protein [Succinivibrionaceae bacterium]|nr:EAL domain-containing protein [Succinivibrionaceae bacterium]